MLSIRDFSGLDLVANPPLASAVKATTDAGVEYTLQVVAVEDDVALPLRQVQIRIDWNDGQQPSVYSYALTSNGTNTVNVARNLTLGDHVIRVEAQNLRAPHPDFQAVNFELTVLPRLQLATPTRLIYGPILPKDSGFPNSQQWNFNTGVDSEVLASAVKMLLSTAKGERMMLPDYGTDLRLIVFDPTTDGMQERAEREITEALAKWEPRVSLQSLQIKRNTDASISINVALLSKLTQQDFTLQTSLTP